jgi:hypothetical protein
MKQKNVPGCSYGGERDGHFSIALKKTGPTGRYYLRLYTHTQPTTYTHTLPLYPYTTLPYGFLEKIFFLPHRKNNTLAAITILESTCAVVTLSVCKFDIRKTEKTQKAFEKFEINLASRAPSSLLSCSQ